MRIFLMRLKLQIIAESFLINLLLAASLFAGTATLTWDAPTTNADGSALTDLAGYKIYYGTSSGNYTQQVNVGNVTSYTLTLTNGATYYFAVTAYDTAGNESGYSNEASKIIAIPDSTPPTLSTITAINISTTGASITWTSNELSSSQVEFGPSSSYGNATPLDANLSTSHAVVLTGLIPGTTYHYRVESSDISGNLATSSDFTFVTLSVPDTTPPSDIQNFTATPGDNNILLTWVNPVDPDFAGVRIRFRTDGQYPVDSNDGTLLGDLVGESGASHSSLQNDVTYYYSAFSYDASGNFTHTVHAIATPMAQTANIPQDGASNPNSGNSGSSDAVSGNNTGESGGGGCFIATAAYGSYLDPHVMVLRGFRDNYLLTNEPGKAFVAFYYKISPPVADFIREHEGLRMSTRLLLTPVIYGVEYPICTIIVLLIIVGVGYGTYKRGFNRHVVVGIGRLWRKRECDNIRK